MFNELLTKLKEENKKVYYLMKLIQLNRNNIIGKNLSAILEKQLYLILFDNLEKPSIEEIIELKLRMNNIIYNVFIANGFTKAPHKDEYILMKDYGNYNLTHTVKKVNDKFKAVDDFKDNYISRLLKYYEEDLDELINLMKRNTDIFWQHNLNFLTDNDKEYYGTILNIIDTLDSSRTIPNSDILEFLNDYKQDKKRKKTK